MNVFITGATGFIGSYALTALKEAGHRPLALVRTGSEDKLPFFEGVTIVPGDITEPGGWVDSLKDVDAIIHLIGVIREFPAKKITFDRLHNEATNTLVNVAINAGVKRFILMSANGASSSGASEYQTSKWLAEEALKSSGLNYTIFRPSVIFGDSGGKMEFTHDLGEVIKKAPVMPIFGDGEYQLDPVAVEDVAECFIRGLTDPKAEGKTFHLGGGKPVSYREIVQAIGKAVGIKRTKTFGAPFALAMPVATLLGRFAFFPVTVDQLKMLKEGNTCPELEYREVFGIEPKPFTYQNMQYLKKKTPPKR